MTPSGTNEEAAIRHVSVAQTLGARHGVGNFMINDGGRIRTANIVVMKVTSQKVNESFGDCGSPTRRAFRAEVGPRQLEGAGLMSMNGGLGHAALLPE